MKIGIFGSSSNDMKETVRTSARRLGSEIAKSGHTLVTGACSGIPHEAVMGAYSSGGRIVGFSPATDLHDHVTKFNYPTEGYTQMIFLSPEFEYKDDIAMSAKYRSIYAVASCDVVIIVGGSLGTMAEFAIALDAGKAIGILEGSGGITNSSIDALLADSERSRAKIFRHSDPSTLLRKLIEVDEQDKHITF
ncbi:MAG: hypothetical protein JW716_00040 [Candidatus Aenigmarchaeota archaeon]|nr:hypothetical protein [Candidatus Aenigmarchaeota archaeon]